ncbi:hypothetical protein ACRAWD_21870 [Caulobacter segnis]
MARAFLRPGCPPSAIVEARSPAPTFAAFQEGLGCRPAGRVTSDRGLGARPAPRRDRHAHAGISAPSAGSAATGCRRSRAWTCGAGSPRQGWADGGAVSLTGHRQRSASAAVQAKTIVAGGHPGAGFPRPGRRGRDRRTSTPWSAATSFRA